MARNSYLQLARLGMHPAFSSRTGRLVCPICRTEHARFGEYDEDFLAHDPSQAMGWQWLSAGTYAREAPLRGWPAADEVFAAQERD